MLLFDHEKGQVYVAMSVAVFEEMRDKWSAPVQVMTTDDGELIFRTVTHLAVAATPRPGSEPPQTDSGGEGSP